MSLSSLTRALALGTLMIGVPVSAQQLAPVPFKALEALNASYDKQLHDLECRRIAELAALAEKSPASEADAAYRHLFGLAIARGLCAESHATAIRCVATPSCGRDTRALAALVQALARTDKGEHDGALDDWKKLLKGPDSRDPGAARSDVELALGVGEAYLRRLIRDGRYDVARRLCALACEDGTPSEVKEHFAGRMARLELIGKPAPAIAATDVDGKAMSLADLKGKVILIDFWATWCPPCVASIPAYKAIAEKFHDKDFVILGVNVDAMHEDVQDARKALAIARRFLVRHQVTWANLVNGEGSHDIASAYHVEEIPANFLVGRDGKIVAVEQDVDRLEQAVIRALAAPTR